MIRRLTLLLLAAATMPASQEAPEPAASVLAPDSEARWVAFDLTPGNQIRFGMELDGRPVTAILDTGVSHSLLARGSPAVRPERLRPGGTATAIGGTVAFAWMPVGRLALGGLTRAGGDLAVAALPAGATGGAAEVDLLVGRDLLAAHALDIDYPARRFRLLPSGRLPFRGTVAPLAVSPRQLVYEGEVTLSGQRIAPVVVDTGDGAALTLARPAWERAAPPGLAVTTTLGFGIAGSAESELAVVPRLALGAREIPDVEVRIEPAGGFSAAIGAAGRIGSGLLGRYRVLLDPAAGRMVLGDGAPGAGGPLRSTSGLLVAKAGDRLRVLHVMRGGPGAASGWRAGDAICAVDGRTITADDAGAWTTAPAGTVTRLRDCAGGERTLVARRFY